MKPECYFTTSLRNLLENILSPEWEVTEPIKPLLSKPAFDPWPLPPHAYFISICLHVNILWFQLEHQLSPHPHIFCFRGFTENNTRGYSPIFCQIRWREYRPCQANKKKVYQLKKKQNFNQNQPESTRIPRFPPRQNWAPSIPWWRLHFL